MMEVPKFLAFGEWNPDGSIRVTLPAGYVYESIPASSLRVNETGCWASITGTGGVLSVKMPRNLQGSKN